jgi:hypothetical protein
MTSDKCKISYRDVGQRTQVTFKDDLKERAEYHIKPALLPSTAEGCHSTPKSENAVIERPGKLRTEQA